MAFGYYAEPTKSILVVKPEHQQQAEEIFGDLQIKITTSSRFLGGCIGDEEGVKEFVSEKVGVMNSYLSLLITHIGIFITHF